MLRIYFHPKNMFTIVLIFCCLGVLVVSECPTSSSEFDESTDFKDEDSEKYDDEPIDHSAFLGIDDTDDLHIPKQTKRVRQRLRAILKKIDSDKDGKFTEKELSDWTEKITTKYLTSEGQNQMPKIDKDNDSLASWVEYSSAAGYTQGDVPEPKKSSEKSKKRDKEKFDLADTDQDGKLSYYELGVMIHPNEASHMSSVVVKEFLELMDRDHDGQLSFSEYLGGDPNVLGVDKEAEQELRKTFKSLDFDQDGKLNNEELTDWLLPNSKSTNQNEAESLIRDVDDNKDGSLSEDEVFNHYNLVATSRVTRYGRLLKEDEPYPEDDDDIPVKKNVKNEKQNEKKEEEKQESKADESRKEKRKQVDEL